MNAQNSNVKPVNVIFNCSPSLGIIDSWMPIISSLREKLPHATFIFIAPKARTIRELDLSSWLHQETSRIFDQVVFNDDSDQWYSSDSFDTAIRHAQKLDPWFVTRALRKLRLGVIASYLTSVQQWLNRSRFKLWSFNFYTKANERGVLLFDLFEIDKPYASYIEDHFSGMERYSLLHGINVRGISDSQSVNGNPVSLRGVSNINALLFSQKERGFYRKKYGIQDSNLHVIGIPRHEAQWLTSLQAVHGAVDFDKSKRFIFVIGRPSNDMYHPKRRKIQALKDIREVAEKCGLNIVVKTHPKEHDDATYMEAFKGMSQGLTFSFSKSHPLVLGRYCVFAVSFYSGVAVDMVRLGTPVIERLDLRGLPYADNAESLRDANNEPVYVHRYLGLALGASDSITFENQVERVMKYRDEVIAEQRAAYDRVYPTIPDINEKIASEIAAAVVEQ